MNCSMCGGCGEDPRFPISTGLHDYMPCGHCKGKGEEPKREMTLQEAKQKLDVVCTTLVALDAIFDFAVPAQAMSAFVFDDPTDINRILSELKTFIEEYPCKD